MYRYELAEKCLKIQNLAVKMKHMWVHARVREREKERERERGGGGAGDWGGKKKRQSVFLWVCVCACVRSTAVDIKGGDRQLGFERNFFAPASLHTCKGIIVYQLCVTCSQ